MQRVFPLSIWNLHSSTKPSYRNYLCIFSILFTTPIGNGNKDIKEVGRLESLLYISVSCPPFDKWILFQLTSLCFILSKMPSQIILDINWTPRNNPKHFKGRWATLQPRIPDNSSKFRTPPPGTISDLLKLIFNLNTASKHRRIHLKRWSWVGSASKIVYHVQIVRDLQCISTHNILKKKKKNRKIPPSTALFFFL